MPRESDKTRQWEKERRNRLNEAFGVLFKHLPDYDPSIKISKIDILHKTADYIEELQKKLQELIDSKTSDKPEGDVIKKLQDRVKKLLNRNEQLTLLLNNAGITVPSIFGTVKKFKAPLPKWSHKFNPKQAKITQKEQEKENMLMKKPRKPRKSVIKSTQNTPKHKKLPVINSKTSRKSKKKNSNVLMLSKNFIVVQQPVVTQSCYVVANTPVTNIIRTTASSIALTTTTFITSTPVIPNLKPATSSVKTNLIPSLGPGTLVFPDGRAVPVLPQITQIPQVITNPFPLNPPTNPAVIVLPKTTKPTKAETMVTNSTKIKMNNKETKSSIIKPSPIPKPKVMSLLSPKICCTNTTQVTKVPIPALTSRYANSFTFSNNNDNNNSNNNSSSSNNNNNSHNGIKKEKTANKTSTKIVGNHSADDVNRKKSGNKRNLESEEVSDKSKKPKIESAKIENEITPTENRQANVNIISSVCIKDAEASVAVEASKPDSNTQVDSNSESRKNLEENDSVLKENTSSVSVTDSVCEVVSKSEDKVIMNDKPAESDLTEEPPAESNLTKEPILTVEKNIDNEKIQEQNTMEKTIIGDNSSAKMESNEEDLELEQRSATKKTSHEELNESISELVSDVTTSLKENLVTSDQHSEKNNTLDTIKDTQESQDKPDEGGNDMKTLEMNLPHSELSNDIFASLQVPSGCQNPESTSPTAAFLLAFPLVSSLTGVKVTEVMDEENMESQSGTPTLLQIGTMESTKPTQSQSESLTPSLLNLDNLSFFSTKDICNSFYNPFDNIPVSLPSSTAITDNLITSKTITTVNASSNSKIVSADCSNNNNDGDNNNHELENTLTKQADTLVLSQPQKNNIQHTSHNNNNNVNNSDNDNVNKSINDNNDSNNSNNNQDSENNGIDNRMMFNNVETKKQFDADIKIHRQDKPQVSIGNQHITSNINSLSIHNVGSNLNHIEKQGNASSVTSSIAVSNAANNLYSNLYGQNNSVLTNNTTTYKQQENLTASDSKNVMLQTSNLGDARNITLQNTYQQSKIKVSETILKNPEQKTCMNFSQNTQQNKPYNNLHCSNFPLAIDNEKTATTSGYNHIQKTFVESLYTNTNVYNYNTESVHNYNKRYDNRNYCNTNYQNYDYCRKNENTIHYSNNYYSNPQSCAKDKYTNNSMKTQQNNQVANQVRPPINWMTTPDNRQNNSEYIMPGLPKENNYATASVYSGNSFISNTQTTYFNSNSIYSNSDIMNDSRKPLDLPLVSVNTYQRTDAEENQFSWSPTKMPQFLEPPTFVSSTLTNLIGDLALGNPTAYLDQKCDKFARETTRNKENFKRAKTNNNYENHSNFLSVSQLVEHNKNESPARTTSRRNSGNRSTNKSNNQNKPSKRSSKTQESKDGNQNFKVMETGSTHKNSQIKQFNIQGNDMFCTNGINNTNGSANGNSNNTNNTNITQANKNRNINKNLTSSYSAEALIGHQPHHIHNDNLQNKQVNNQQNYTSNSKSLPVPSFLPENIISYFPPVDIPQENTFNQNQNYQPTTFSHNFTSTFQNNSYNSNFIPPVTAITTNYLPTSNFIHDVTTHDYLSDNLNIFASKDTKQYNKSAGKHTATVTSREDKTIQSSTSSCSNYKKTKRKQTTESTVPNFVDFPFLSVPGAINSPILPDDFHAHSSFLPPPTPSQLYSCKNPLYPKQNTDLTASSLLPLPPPVPVSRSNIQHPEISPSINTGGTSLTNFNLSTIFPEINKSPINGLYPPDTRPKEQPTRSYTTSGSQVPFSNKSTFSLSYLNCPVSQYSQ